MNIIQLQQDDVEQIEILGLLEQPEEQEGLFDLLQRPHQQQPLKLIFYDVCMLPAKLLRLLVKIDEQRPLRLIIYREFFAHVCHRLGLTVIRVPLNFPELSYQRPRAIAIGGSADSLNKILTLIEQLPVSQLVVFVVQHIQEQGQNLLDHLLRVRTDYQVEMPQHLTKICPGTVYIAPPGHHLKVGHGFVYLTQDRKVNHARPSIDVLFSSLAVEYHAQLTAILLCGYGQDGVAGLKVVRQVGGLALVETAEECTARMLPQQAKVQQAYDAIFPLAALSAQLVTSALPATLVPNATQLASLLTAIYHRYGYDFRGYQIGTLERRLVKLAKQLGCDDFWQLQLLLLTDSLFFEYFFLEISVNVTHFFRHPEQFRFLRQHVIPLLDSFPRIKIWIAGCATGEEVYSLAILLDELGLLERSFIYATDINAYVLELAKSGLYPREQFEEDQHHYRQAGGIHHLSRYVHLHKKCIEIQPRLCQNILFYHHSLTHDGPFNEFQLIICRNVLIYFDVTLQQQVLQLFSRSLHREGYLLLGQQEWPEMKSTPFTLFDAEQRLYQLAASIP